MEISIKKSKKQNIAFTKNEITSIIEIDKNSKECILNFVREFKTEESDLKTKNLYETVEKLSLKSNVFWLKEDYYNMLFNITIKEDIKFYLGEYDKEKLVELLKVFELNISILDKSYIELSSSETRKILIVIGLLSQVKTLIIENPTLRLDIKSRDSLIKVLKREKRQKKIILISYNTDFLLEVSDNIMIFDKDRLIKSGKKFDILADEKLLNRINLDIPNVIRIINKVKQLKSIKLGYRDNINDLIKDIYRYAK